MYAACNYVPCLTGLFCFMVLQVAGSHAAEHMQTWDSQAIANMVWAYAKMEVCHDRLMAAVATALTGLSHKQPWHIGHKAYNHLLLLTPLIAPLVCLNAAGLLCS